MANEYSLTIIKSSFYSFKARLKNLNFKPWNEYWGIWGETKTVAFLI